MMILRSWWDEDFQEIVNDIKFLKDDGGFPQKCKYLIFDDRVYEIADVRMIRVANFS